MGEHTARGEPIGLAPHARAQTSGGGHQPMALPLPPRLAALIFFRTATRAAEPPTSSVAHGRAERRVTAARAAERSRQALWRWWRRLRQRGMDNEALYDICFRTLKLTTPTYGAPRVVSVLCIVATAML